MKKKFLKNIEWGILICCIILLLIGLVAVYSSTNDTEHDEFKKQIIWISISIPIAIIVIFIDYNLIAKISPIFYAIFLALLVGVLFTPEVNGAHSWFKINEMLAFQPSEFAKIIVIVFLVQSNNKEDEKTLAYTDLIKQIAASNVEKVEMTTGSTTIKVTLKNEIDENGEIIKNNEENKQEEATAENTEKGEEEVNEKLIKSTIVPSTQTFIELIQSESVDKGNDIELIQKSPSIFVRIPSYIISLLPTILMIILFVMIKVIFI